MLQIVSGEALAEGAGLGDFDASLVAAEGHAAEAQPPAWRYLLGGVADIEIGKLPDRQIVLPGMKVSRQHCKLVRVNFGPSCWKIVDNGSRNGVVVNGVRIAEHELRNGDLIAIGEHFFKYEVEAEAPAVSVVQAPQALVGTTSDAVVDEAQIASPAVVAAAIAGGQLCPSCQKALAPNSKICIDCGIHVVTGRPLITRMGIDEEELYAAAYQVIRYASYLIRFQPLPMPIRSEAYGAKKPYAIWTIAIVTTLMSLVYFFMRYPGVHELNLDRPGTELMLFSPWVTSVPVTLETVSPNAVQDIARRITPLDREELEDKYDPNGQMSDRQLAAHLLVDAHNYTHGNFHWYQLFTHMFLHEPTSFIGFLLHLGPNMVFLLVFGTRVNALLGDLATTVLYFVVGICAAVTHLVAMGAHGDVGMVGASGAIFGLAGIYLILFPVHKVICAVWLRIGILIRRLLLYKIFAVRGFWILLIYFAFNLLLGLISARMKGNGGGIAYWAHIGGFTSGVVIGLAIMFSRQFNANNGDLLSIVLGKFSWLLIGKPSQWKDRKQSLLGTLTFAGGALCLLVAAMLVVGFYDPRTPQEKMFAQLMAGMNVSSSTGSDSSRADPSGADSPNSGTPAPENAAGGKSAPAATQPQAENVAFTANSSPAPEKPPDGASETEIVGGNGGIGYMRVDANRRPVIGFAIKVGESGGHDTIGRCDPIYDLNGAPRSSDVTVCVARDGYVVSGIVVNGKEETDGVEIIFAKKMQGGVDAGDTYTSEWFGDEEGSDQTQLAGHGENVIGIVGRQGQNNEAIGLVIDAGKGN
jgi:membrane associated rhomboid family serine protease